MPSNFSRNSLKTKEDGTDRVTHFSGVFLRRLTARRLAAGRSDCLAKRRFASA